MSMYQTIQPQSVRATDCPAGRIPVAGSFDRTSGPAFTVAALSAKLARRTAGSDTGAPDSARSAGVGRARLVGAIVDRAVMTEPSAFATYC